LSGQQINGREKGFLSDTAAQIAGTERANGAVSSVQGRSCHSAPGRTAQPELRPGRTLTSNRLGATFAASIRVTADPA
jgi:hypothetical protein